MVVREMREAVNLKLLESGSWSQAGESQQLIRISQKLNERQVCSSAKMANRAGVTAWNESVIKVISHRARRISPDEPTKKNSTCVQVILVKEASSHSTSGATKTTSLLVAGI